jgi:hypothetical protein
LFSGSIYGWVDGLAAHGVLSDERGMVWVELYAEAVPPRTVAIEPCICSVASITPGDCANVTDIAEHNGR